MELWRKPRTPSSPFARFRYDYAKRSNPTPMEDFAMARTNTAARNMNRTHEGAPAVPVLTAEMMLRRSVLSCLLFEREFYEDGQEIAARIVDTAEKVAPEKLAEIAIAARTTFNLRHVPLLLLDVLCRTGVGHGSLVQNTIDAVIQRADEPAELLSIFWRNTPTGQKRKMIPAQMRKGLAKAFARFNEYHLAKYAGKGDKVTLRDALRMARPTPTTAEQSALWRRVTKRELATPITWETELSAGKDKRAVFERLILEQKLGYFALLRNLRNMVVANVDPDLVRAAIVARKGGAERILPFRYVAAARAAPMFEPELDVALKAAISEMPKFQGKTLVLVDVSGSMNWPLSAKSDMKRIDAGAALAAMITADDLRMFTFSNVVVEVPPRRGMAGVDAIVRSQQHDGTELGRAVREMNAIQHDRLIVLTDEQSSDPVPDPVCGKAYMINVASAKNGVGYGRWTHVDGFSEGVLRFIHEVEMDASHRLD
jgi:hypothetical protein